MYLFHGAAHVRGAGKKFISFTLCHGFCEGFCDVVKVAIIQKII